MDKQKIRLFVDMDGTLAEWKQLHLDIKQYEDAAVTQQKVYQILRQPGYYRELAPHENVVQAIRFLIQNMPDIEVFILSCYPDQCSALEDKNAWLDKYIPEIDKEHRIFVPDGEPKKHYVPNGIRSTDFLLDDYTHNLVLWGPPKQGIKLFNGINGNRQTWKGNALNYNQSPEVLVDNLSGILLNHHQIIHTRPQDQIETEGIDL